MTELRLRPHWNRECLCLATHLTSDSRICRKIEEDEYCLIPMGGVLPRVPQRVLGIGGTAGMVHPSTGAPLPFICRAVSTIGFLIMTLSRL